MRQCGAVSLLARVLSAGNLLLVSPVVGPDEVNRRVCDESEKEDDKNETKSGPHLSITWNAWTSTPCWKVKTTTSPAASTITLATCTCYSRVTPCAGSNSTIVAIPYAFAPGRCVHAAANDACS